MKSVTGASLLAAGLLALTACGDSTAPTSGATQGATEGAVRVTATTTGVDLPSAGYMVSVDSGAGQAIPVNGEVTLSALQPGGHSVTLYGAPPNCALSGANARAVDVITGDTVLVAFNVSCTATTHIAFVSNRDGNWHIYVTSAEGVTRLTVGPQVDGNPAWSPDGARIAFATNRDGNFEIYVMDGDGSHLARLTNTPADDYDPAWSPDGTKIAFTSERDGQPEVYMMESDGSSPVRLTTEPSAEDPTWSPDGTKIAFVSHRDGNGQIYVINADGSHVTRLTNDATEDCEPAWSPDGRHIAFVSGCTSDLFPTSSSHIYLVNADGSNPVQLTRDVPEQARFPAWSPDGMAIAFAGPPACRYYDADGCYWWWTYEIHVVRIDGTPGPTAVPGSEGNYNDVDPSWRR